MHIACPHCHNLIEVVRLAPKEIICPSCGSTFQLEGNSTTTFTPLAGQKIGKFEILETVGMGAFGTVYKARDPELDRVVAVKVPRAGNLSGDQDRDRFLREARSVAQLRHPAIVPVYEVGQENGLPYLASEFVEGMTLADLLSGRRLSFAEACRIIAALADALQYAHDRGVVHRDVKPSNVLLDGEGRPHLMDFGLARRDAGEITMTVDGQVLGTPAYMSPEQARGEAHQVDGRGDVYSLGVILYQMLTGELPFRGTTRMLLHQVLHDEPRPPRRHNDRIPRDLETICLKCLQKEPARRYANALDLAGDLRRFLNSDPILARPVGTWERTRRWIRRRPGLASSLAASLLISIVAFTLVTWKWQAAVIAQHDEEQARIEAEQAQQAEAEALRKQRELTGQLESALGRAQYNLYLNQLMLAQRDLAANRVDQVQELLNACPAELRDWEWRLLLRAARGGRALVRAHPGDANAIAFSPDGKWLATANGNELATERSGEVCVWEAAGGRRVWPAVGKAHHGPVESLTFSPDGKLVATASTRLDVGQIFAGKDVSPKGEVVIWNAATGAVAHVLPDACCKVAFSPDGKRLAAAGHDMKVRVWNAGNWKDPPLELPRSPGTKISALAFRPGDGRLAVASRQIHAGDKGAVRFDVALVLRNLEKRQEERRFKGHEATVNHVVFSPDGKRLASASSDRTVKVWDADAGTLLFTLAEHTKEVNSVAFSADGKFLASGSADQAVMVWSADDGGLRFTLRGHATPVNDLAFDPTARGDSWRLVSIGQNGTVKSWDRDNSQSPRAFRGHTALVTHAILSPDGGRLASCDAGQTVRIWDVRSGRELHNFRCAALRLAFSADGARLACAGGETITAPGVLSIYDIATGKLLHDLRGKCGPGPVKSVAFSPDGTFLAAASAFTDLDGLTKGRVQVAEAIRGEITVWNLAGPAPTEVFRQPGYACVAYAPDGRHIALCRGDATVEIWHVGDRRRVQQLAGHTDVVESLAFSPDGTSLAAGSVAQLVIVWDPTTAKERFRLSTGRGVVSNLAFTPDGRRLATAVWNLSENKGELKLWDARKGKEVLTLPGQMSVSFSGDGQQLATLADGDFGAKVILIRNAAPLP